MAPVIAAVDAPEHAGARNTEYGAGPPSAGEDAVHIDHVVVDVLAVVDFLPVLAAIGTAIGPRLCSGVDDLALQRMHSKGADRWHFRQAAWQGLPLVAAVGQPKQPGVYHPAFSGFTSEAKVKMGG